MSGILIRCFCCPRWLSWPSTRTRTKPPKAPSSSATKRSSREGRYANMPDEAVPYRRFTEPYYDWFIREDTLQYNGAADLRPDGSRRGSEGNCHRFFLTSREQSRDDFRNPSAPWRATGHRGSQRARGYHGKPYALKIHSESALWGASSTELVKMLFDENCWGMAGCMTGRTAISLLRTSLKLEMPMVDIGTTHPTVTETHLPWLIHNFPDDRQQGYTLAITFLRTSN